MASNLPGLRRKRSPEDAAYRVNPPILLTELLHGRNDRGRGYRTAPVDFGQALSCGHMSGPLRGVCARFPLPDVVTRRLRRPMMPLRQSGRSIGWIFS
jgi:hypothetical protein